MCSHRSITIILSDCGPLSNPKERGLGSIKKLETGGVALHRL